MFIHVTIMEVVQVPIMKVIDVPVMLNGLMATARAVYMVV